MKELSTNERLRICHSCPIFNNNKCNSKLWINPDTDEVSTYAKPGYIRGCGCLITVKAKSPLNHCIAGKW